ncbi:MAG: GTP cyclohydrolase II RibA [Rhodospirillales bacterium]|nr:GTP cyclohydrolase II RibA [Rhodospirillales bacterium]
MGRFLHVVPVPVSREPVSLRSVDRAMADLRRGRPVAVAGGGGTASLVLAAEAATPESLRSLADMASTAPVVVITSRRAAVLGLGRIGLKAVAAAVADGLTADLVQALADPLAQKPDLPLEAIQVSEAEQYSCESAAVLLVKTARLLPAVVSAAINAPDADDLPNWANRHGLLWVDAGDVFQYDFTAARSLKPVSEARVPLLGAEDARIVAFRPYDGGLEHLAVLLGDPAPPAAVLTRIHSECFTGDLLGSLRCDCGDQLRGAIREIASAGGGLLLYLAQEGRGIGLVNKLRAYELQDRGFDTLDANEQLGFDADERVYVPAAQMLRHLGFSRVRLLTNNPGKVDGLARCGIVVEERVPHAFPSNRHNEVYMRTKAGRGGHLL